MKFLYILLDMFKFSNIKLSIKLNFNVVFFVNVISWLLYGRRLYCLKTDLKFRIAFLLCEKINTL